ncbi:MAG: bifunctional chorismate mutase/prephenate dehydrogenase [Parashewanella sp.]
MTQNDNKLDVLRQQIDVIDSELLSLINKRLQLVEQVGRVKHEVGLPIYVPSREASMIKKRRLEAEKLGVAPQLIEDILRRLMRESYQNEKTIGFKQVNPNAGHIVIVGGKGQFGELFRQMLSLSGYQVYIVDKNDWHLADVLFEGASLVLVTVPISLTCELILDKLGTLPEDCVLADLTSIKSAPMAAMLKAHKGPVVGFHPMFGPNVMTFAKQVMITCHGRMPEKYQWLLEQIKLWGTTLVESNVIKHDSAMATVQALRHFSTFVYGVTLFENKENLQKLLQFSSPIYRLELAMVGRLFAQDPELYMDIIFSQSENLSVIKSHSEHYLGNMEMLVQKDKHAFINKFNDVAQWFGELAQQFQQESNLVIQAAGDINTISN